LANITLKEIAVLDDQEDIYTAVTLSKGPEDTVSNLTEEQRKKYQSKQKKLCPSSEANNCALLEFAEKQNFKTPRAELPTDFAHILPELAATVTEVDLAGIVVDLTPNSCVLADNKKQYVNIQLSNTWSFEALDKIVIVGAVLGRIYLIL